MRRRPLLLALGGALTLALFPGACATSGRMDVWRAPSRSRAPVPSREEAVILLPPAVRAKVSPKDMGRVFEDGLRSQLEHATLVLGGQALAPALAEAGLGRLPGRMAAAMAHSAFDEDSEILSADHDDVLGALPALHRLVEAEFAGKPVRWILVTAVEEQPTAKDLQDLLRITAGLYDLRSGTIASMVRFDRYAEPGKLTVTVRTAGMDAAARLTREDGPPTSAADEPPPEPQGPR